MSGTQGILQKTALVTGCSRGIGLGLVKEFLKGNFRVVATCRNPKNAKALNEILSQHNQQAAIRLVFGLSVSMPPRSHNLNT